MFTPGVSGVPGSHAKLCVEPEQSHTNGGKWGPVRTYFCYAVRLGMYYGKVDAKKLWKNKNSAISKSSAVLTRKQIIHIDMSFRICDLESFEEWHDSSIVSENKCDEPIITNKAKLKILCYFVFLQLFFIYSFYADFFVPKSPIILSSALLVSAGGNTVFIKHYFKIIQI